MVPGAKLEPLGNPQRTAGDPGFHHNAKHVVIQWEC